MQRPFNTAVRSSLLTFGYACLALASARPAAAAEVLPQHPELHIQAAERLPAANTSMMLSASLAGKRIVAVGDQGVVLLSDDDGKSFRQARSVPVSSTLTGVSFVDANTGWAVGQWGVIIKTDDAGDSWRIQRSDITVDQPLFSVYFKNAQEGWAVGLWSLMLHTADGGKTWATVKLPPAAGSKKIDRNLYQIFADRKGNLFVACEQGRVMRSVDGGNTWTYQDTGYTGSLWTGVALQDGTLLVGGLRGSIYRSTDGGSTWLPAQCAFKSSVTNIAQLADGSIIAVALDGVSLASHDGGVSFVGTQRSDRAALTALVPAPPGPPVVFSTNGPIS